MLLIPLLSNQHPECWPRSGITNFVLSSRRIVGAQQSSTGHAGTDCVCHHIRTAVDCNSRSTVYLASPALFKISTHVDEIIPAFQKTDKKLYLCLVEEDGSFNQLSEVEVLHRDNIMWERGINFY